MTKNEHTPGPWKYTPTNTELVSHIIRSTDGWAVATVTPKDGDETAQNAQLIAAAPDMLEALEGALDTMGFLLAEVKAQGDIPQDDEDLARDRYDQVLAAIAKAKGES